MVTSLLLEIIYYHQVTDCAADNKANWRQLHLHCCFNALQPLYIERIPMYRTHIVQYTACSYYFWHITHSDVKPLQ